jgi:hypothetical protein
MKLRNQEHLAVTDTDYGAVLLDTKSGAYWQLNPTAALVTRTLLDGGDLEVPPGATVAVVGPPGRGGPPPAGPGGGARRRGASVVRSGMRLPALPRGRAVVSRPGP